METMEIMLKKFYHRKVVLVTGHTGFKGSWLCEVLQQFGSDVVGYALEPRDSESLFQFLQLGERMHHYIAPIQDLRKLNEIFRKHQPEIVFHMAAQPLVRESYFQPVYTYETNVMGTVNLLECVRLTPSVRSVVNITTDKVYENFEWQRGYREDDRLNGYDPYSNSKSCSELVTDAYRKSFFLNQAELSVSTVRSGNVIGGGDFSKDRIIPDCVRAIQNGESICLRSPYSIRPYQHVLESLFLYLELAMLQTQDKSYSGAYNIGPDNVDCLQTEELVRLFCDDWNRKNKMKLYYEVEKNPDELHEAEILRLDCSKVKRILKWSPVWNIKTGVEKTTDWYTAYMQNQNVQAVTQQQIEDYLRSV